MVDLKGYESRWLSQAGRLSRKARALNASDAECYQLITEISDNMKRYASLWHGNAQRLRAAGTYKTIAEHIAPSDSYLDIGCGTGELIEAVKFPNALGIDINHYCLQTAEKYLESEGVKTNSFASSILKWYDKIGIAVVPVDENKARILERGKANLLQDDIRVFSPRRSLEIARRHIKEIGKPDYVSFTLVGGGMHAAGELCVPLSERGMMQYAMTEQMRQTASEILPRGGHFVEAHRYTKVPGVLDTVRDEFESMFGDVFEIEEMSVHDLPVEDAGSIYLFVAGKQQTTTHNSDLGSNVCMIVTKSRRK